MPDSNYQPPKPNAFEKTVNLRMKEEVEFPTINFDTKVYY
jgi:hypothetical protein